MDEGPPEERARRGRPRDPRVDREVTRAARDLLAEQGYAALTIKGVAERSHTSVPTIYRRWTSKAELVLDVVFTDVTTTAPLTGELDADVRTLVRTLLDVFGRPAARAALAGLVSEAPDVGYDLAARWWHIVEEVVDSAREEQLLRTDVDPDVLMSVLLGPAMVASFVGSPAGRSSEDLVDQVTRLTLAAIRR